MRTKHPIADTIIGARIRQLRTDKGVSRATLAKAIGVTHQQLSKYEDGSNAVTMARLVQIAQVLDTDPETIVATDDLPAVEPIKSRAISVDEGELDPFDIHIGYRIALRREMQNISLTQLSDGMGITYQAFGKYERGIARINASKLLVVAQLLDAPLSWFIEGAPPPIRHRNST